MDIKAIREFINRHPEGVVIHMVDGSTYDIPHRDWVWFTPATDMSEAKVGRFSTSFYVAVDGVGSLVNALLVTKVVPRKPQREAKTSNRRRAG
jgi:hypothetical protein